MNLRKKVFIAFMAFIVLPLFVLGLITYLVSQYIIGENYAEQSELTLKAVGRNLTYVLKEANYFSESYMLREDIQSVLGTGQTFDAVALTEYGRLLQRTFLSYTPAYSAALYDFDGKVFSEGKIGYRRLSYEELFRQPVYKEAMRLNGIPVWIGPHEEPELTGDGPFFTMLRVVNDKYTLDNKGILLQQFQFQELNKIFNDYDSGRNADNRYMLVNQDGLVMVDSKSELQGLLLSGLLSSSMDWSKDYDSRKLEFGGVESVVSVHHPELDRYGKMNWSVVSVTPWRYLSGKTEQVLRWIGAITALCLLSALLFNLLFVNRNIRFILYVVQLMKRVEIGDLRIRAEAASNDETSVLARGFNSLVERISGLLEEVKREQERKNKAELMLLQAQIKPHFLFNTLESINALAAQNEGRKVNKMVRQLSTILRISFQTSEQIPLSLEMDHLRNYLEIQSYRFEELFEYELDIPNSLRDSLILKLTLQPLVENSIQHGFEGIAYKGRVHVKAEDHGEHIVLWVDDNGIGIDSAVLSRLHYKSGISQSAAKLHAAAIAAAVREEGASARTGLGLPNVADRLRIRYGCRYGLWLCSEPGQGTLIRIVIPKQTAGEPDEA
ncbi:sensor histidine kinase [Paenibacillus sp. NPDC056579]|uniref:cache domain-containing sensor histidine kinase n=1 Tax=Paenibacillus sp. NPDC056579 TaxID=3345871 RepID=UPI0036CD9301